MKKSIPKGLIYPQTVKASGGKGEAFGPQERILRNIQQEKPYLHTGATTVILKRGVKPPVDSQYPRGPPDQHGRPNQPVIDRKYRKS